MATVTSIRKAKLKPTIGGLIDQMNDIREQRRVIAAQDKVLEGEINATQEQLIELMDAEGCTKSTGRTASASISENIVFNTVDWDLFMAHLIKHKLAHLVQRRVSAPAVAEQFALKKPVPGLEPFTQRKINLRAL